MRKIVCFCLSNQCAWFYPHWDTRCQVFIVALETKQVCKMIWFCYPSQCDCFLKAKTLFFVLVKRYRVIVHCTKATIPKIVTVVLKKKNVKRQRKTSGTVIHWTVEMLIFFGCKDIFKGHGHNILSVHGMGILLNVDSSSISILFPRR